MVDELEQLRTEGERLAKMFRQHREDLRAVALRAVTHYGVSVVRAATAGGMDRRTLTVWLQVFNAENKGREK